MDITGQWTGSFEGQTNGALLLNVERRRGKLTGSLSLFQPDTNAAPGGIYRLDVLQEAQGSITGEATIFAGATMSANQLVTVEEVKKLTGLQLPQKITFRGQSGNERLEISWATDIGTNGKAEAERSGSNGPSAVPSARMDWDEFRREVRKFQPRTRLFRGQDRPWPLRTAFHRNGRTNLLDFPADVTPRLRAAVSAVTSFVFPTEDGAWNAALLALAQHHGYPTPLLDWTWSPYIAAYFACHKCIESSSEVHPRLLIFDSEAWSTVPIHSLINTPYPVLSIIEPVPLHNPRVLPQQSVVTFTNMYDVEKYVATVERARKAQYLRAIDFTDDPKEIMVDLRMMGISAATLFPGLDGVCRGLYEESIERS